MLDRSQSTTWSKARRASSSHAGGTERRPGGFRIPFYLLIVLLGAALMLAFGLGTLPNLLLMGVAAQQLNRWVRHPSVRRGAGLLVIGFGLLLLADAWL